MPKRKRTKRKERKAPSPASLRRVVTTGKVKGSVELSFLVGDALADIERRIVREVLVRLDWNYRAAAVALKMDPRTAYRIVPVSQKKGVRSAALRRTQPKRADDSKFIIAE